MENLSLEKWRVFFAIPIDHKTRENIVSSLKEASIEIPGRALPSESWHVTLAFLGSMAQPLVKKLTKTFSQKSWPLGFNMNFETLGAFPNFEKAKIFWCGITEGQSEIQILAQNIWRFLKEEGFSFDERHFHEHLSLSRLKTPLNLKALEKTKIRPVEMNVSRFALFRSVPQIGPQNYLEIASMDKVQS